MVDGEWSEESSAASHELVVIEENGEELPLEGAPQHQLSMTRLVDVTSPQSEAEASAESGKRSQSEHAAVAESSWKRSQTTNENGLAESSSLEPGSCYQFDRTGSCYQLGRTGSCYQLDGTGSCYQLEGTGSCYQLDGTGSCYQLEMEVGVDSSG